MVYKLAFLDVIRDIRLCWDSILSTFVFSQLSYFTIAKTKEEIISTRDKIESQLLVNSSLNKVDSRYKLKLKTKHPTAFISFLFGDISFSCGYSSTPV